MDFEWDERKRQSNLAKHEVDFVAAAKIFEGEIEVIVDARRDYGEVRAGAYGVAAGEVLYVIYTMRGDICRIISARRAGSDEARAYHTRFGRPDTANERQD